MGSKWISLRDSVETFIVDDSHARYAGGPHYVGVMGAIISTQKSLRFSRPTLMSVEEWILGMILTDGDFILKSQGHITEFWNDYISLPCSIDLEIVTLLRDKLRPRILKCVRNPLEFAKTSLESEVARIYAKFRRLQRDQKPPVTQSQEELRFDSLDSDDIDWEDLLPDHLSEEDSLSESEVCSFHFSTFNLKLRF